MLIHRCDCETSVSATPSAAGSAIVASSSANMTVGTGFHHHGIIIVWRNISRAVSGPIAVMIGCSLVVHYRHLAWDVSQRSSKEILIIPPVDLAEVFRQDSKVVVDQDTISRLATVQNLKEEPEGDRCLSSASPRLTMAFFSTAFCRAMPKAHPP